MLVFFKESNRIWSCGSHEHNRNIQDPSLKSFSPLPRDVSDEVFGEKFSRVFAGPDYGAFIASMTQKKTTKSVDFDF